MVVDGFLVLVVSVWWWWCWVIPIEVYGFCVVVSALDDNETSTVTLVYCAVVSVGVCGFCAVVFDLG